MWTIIKISWKNIWRNPVRSSVVIAAVMLGIWAGIFIVGFTNGMSLQRLHDQLDTYTGHIQIHTPAFNNDRKVSEYIPNGNSVLSQIRKTPGVIAAIGHTIATGLASSSTNSYGTSIVGVKPQQESTVLRLPHKLVEGTFFKGAKRFPVVIGKSLAKRLNVHLGSKIVLTFQDTANNITASAFRIEGIFKTSSNTYDESHVFVRSGDLNNLLGTHDLIHEIVIKTGDAEKDLALSQKIQKTLPGLSVQSWQEVAPELRLLDSTIKLEIYIFMTILVLALALGIVNTMLMAILERTRELGMLMAVGMNKKRVFLMIVSETFFLSFIGAPLGIFFSWLTIHITGEYGINLSMVARGLSQFGYGSIIYPVLDNIYYFHIALMMVAAALLSAIYPAIKALRLRPVQAIRKI
ncbi:MAG TPA: FtsX-like permease family protein [Balneolales bacterium]|nr:FtsX-like permease family protein [Balneolales bacterium]